MKILSIETSCDETAAAVIESSTDGSYVHLLSQSLSTSLSDHAKTGGIIPEMAARQQIKFIIPVIYEALSLADSISPMANGKTNHTLSAISHTPDIDAIAVTYGPGLIGSLLVGVETAKTLSYVWNKPLIPVNHLFGHIYANWISPDLSVKDNFQSPEFPAIALVVSGGHTDLVLMKSHTDITWLGGTKDDAAGECFDKCARLLGYSYPGGPKISQLAQKGNSKAFLFPRPMIGNHDYHFSFSGLKTAFLNETKKHFSILRTTSEKIGWEQVVLEEQASEKDKQILFDLCASLEQAIVDALVKKTLQAALQYNVKSILLSGGVAANENLKQTFQKMLNTKYKLLNTPFFVPPKKLCTDNAAMIAAAAFFRNDRSSWSTLVANPQLYFV